MLQVNSHAKPFDRKDTAYLRTLTQNTGDNPQDLGGEEGEEGESTEYESFEEDIVEVPPVEEV